MGEKIRCVFTNVRDQPGGPVRAAFYVPGANPGQDAAQHIAAMQYGGIDAGLIPWRGAQDASDGQLGALLSATSAAGSAFRWAGVYAPEQSTDPTTAQLHTDLLALQNSRAGSDAYLDVGSRFVVFVPVGAADGCATAARWAQAAGGTSAYIVLQAFPGHDACPAGDAPDDWYSVDPQQTVTRLPGSSYAISPSARNPGDWTAAVAGMVNSDERWQLVTSFNDTAAATDVQSAPAWSSATTYGDYLDALHADGAPVVAAAGDIACDPTLTGFNGGLGDARLVPAACKVSDLLVGQRLQRVLALGDNQYDDGLYGNFLLSYDPSWGRVKAITPPAVGNHEYQTPARAGLLRLLQRPRQAAGPAGARGKGYYSYDVGSWHVVVLNSNCTEIAPAGCAAGVAQESG